MRYQRVTNVAPVGRYRRATLEGRPCLVVPMVMITEGVHNGSDGPLYYPAEELARVPGVWDQKPVVVNHPTRNGVGVSACEPDIIEKYKVGVVMNTRYVKGHGDVPGKLRAEAWLYVDRLQALAPTVLMNIERGVPGEISTGLVTDKYPSTGNFRGKRYHAIARNHAPDHLALLPDQVGACSVDAGCGLSRNAGFDPNEARDKTGKWTADGSGGGGGGGGSDFHVEEPEALLENLSEIDRSGDEEEITDQELQDHFADVKHDLGVLKAKGKLSKKEKALKDTLTETALVIDEMLHRSMGDEWPSQLDDPEFNSAPPKEAKPGTRKVDREVAKLKKELGYKPRSDYSKEAYGDGTKNSSGKEPDMGCTDKEKKMKDKKDKVDGLVKNAGWPEADREFLEGLDDERLDRLVANAAKPVESPAPAATPAAPAAPVANAAAPAVEKVVTPEEYIAKAPPAIRDMLTFGLATHNQQRQTAITEITANKANTFTAEQLAAKELPELQQIASLARAAAAQAQVNNRTPNFAGAEGGQVVVNAGTETPLGLPTWNFKEKASA